MGTTERELVSFDYAVKYLLRDKSDFVILSGFLTELLDRKVEVQAILESETNKVIAGEKVNRVDLKAEMDNGELAVFEFQFYETTDFFERVLYGVSKAITEHVEAGKAYKIKKVYSINIAYFNLGAQREYLFFGEFGGFKGVHFKNESIPFGVSEASGADIQPEYYLILPKMFDDRLRGRFDEWVYILKHSAVPDGFTAKGIEEAKVKLDLLRMSPEDRKTYETYMDNKTSIDNALDLREMKGEAKGLAKGLEEGRAEGLEEGRAAGLEEGRAEGERQKALEIAKNLKAGGMGADGIAKVTGLPVDDIKLL